MLDEEEEEEVVLIPSFFLLLHPSRWRLGEMLRVGGVGLVR